VKERLERLAELVPDGVGLVVDVGADHGHLAHAVGAVATERQPGRIGRRDVPWVVADGLRPFREVDVAVVSGMGARTIARVLAAGPRPRVAAVLHAPDDPPVLRRWLAANGWRIDAERLAPEAGRYAEVLRAVPGKEESSGLLLDHGPRLRERGDPLLRAHLDELLGWLEGVAAATATAAPAKSADFAARAAYVAAWRAEVGP
jgi:tRNA (adenine22-N1)-methyltransferase